MSGERNRPLSQDLKQTYPHVCSRNIQYVIALHPNLNCVAWNIVSGHQRPHGRRMEPILTELFSLVPIISQPSVPILDLQWGLALQLRGYWDGERKKRWMNQ